jgi:hypothetical protein
MQHLPPPPLPPLPPYEPPTLTLVGNLRDLVAAGGSPACDRAPVPLPFCPPRGETVPVTGILVAVLAVVLQVPQVRRVWLRLTRASVEDLALRSFSETFRLMSALFGPRATLMLRTGSDNR